MTNREDKLIRQNKKARLSKGEVAVAKFLMGNNVFFYRNFFFKELNVTKKWKLLFFDFYLPKEKVCIEFDGIQHYTREYMGKKMENGARNDFYKNAFCLKKGIKLLRIKYTDIDNVDEIICKWFDKHF
jgi:very-short-patch-repair endonuclease